MLGLWVSSLRQPNLEHWAFHRLRGVCGTSEFCVLSCGLFVMGGTGIYRPARISGFGKDG